ncbi:hypothetical protein [Tenacibaculum ovolyticum]|nr:hypothetical protein [Tenacibaculum ovolyticum]
MKKSNLPIITKYLVFATEEENLPNSLPLEIKDFPESFSNTHKQIIRL